MNIERDFSSLFQCFEEANGYAPKTSKEVEDWFRAFMLFLTVKNFDIISPGLQKAEERVLNSDLSNMYLSALRDVLDIQENESDSDRLMQLVTASSDSRIQACALCMNMTNDDDIWDWIEQVN